MGFVWYGFEKPSSWVDFHDFMVTKAFMKLKTFPSYNDCFKIIAIQKRIFKIFFALNRESNVFKCNVLSFRIFMFDFGRKNSRQFRNKQLNTQWLYLLQFKICKSRLVVILPITDNNIYLRIYYYDVDWRIKYKINISVDFYAL